MRREARCGPLAGMPLRPFVLSETDRRLVLEAYRAGLQAHRPVADCYLAAIDVVHRLYPQAAREVIARQVVAIITSDVSLAEIARR
jgi:hypothetical protein